MSPEERKQEETFSQSTSNDLERYGVWVHPTEDSSPQEEKSVPTIDDLQDDIGEDHYAVLGETPSVADPHDSSIQEKIDHLSKEIEQVKSDIAEIHSFLKDLKQSVGRGISSQVTPKQGFFDQEDAANDRAIALTGSELDNILRTSDIVEEDIPEDPISNAELQQKTPEEEELPGSFFTTDNSEAPKESSELDIDASPFFQDEEALEVNLPEEEAQQEDALSDDSLLLNELTESHIDKQEAHDTETISFESLESFEELNIEDISQRKEETPSPGELSEEIDLSSYGDLSLSESAASHTEVVPPPEEEVIPSPSDLNINTEEFDALATSVVHQKVTPSSSAEHTEDIRLLLSLVEKIIAALAPPEKEHIMASTEWDIVRRLSAEIGNSTQST